MSQAGIVDIEGAHPQIPTLFVCNVGSAIPIANTLEILGEAVAAHSIPLETVGSGNTVEIEVQYASAAASSVANNAGVASFNSADFTVDANGYVTISGSSTIESFEVDAFTAPGTNPVTPNGSGVVTVTGGQVAAGTTTNVIRTNSLAANTYTIQIQRSQAVASSTIGDNGVCHFNSSQFTVDGNGFVTAISGGSGIATIDGDTGSATGSTITFNANSNSGSSVKFVASSATVDLMVTDSNKNTIIGSGAGNSSISGADSVGLGYQVLASSTSNGKNVAIGYQALTSATFTSPGTGGNNVAIGYTALTALNSGTNDICIGAQAGSSITSGNSNTSIGATSLSTLSTGSNNTCLGAFALYQLSTGSNNIAIGISSTNGGTSYTGSESNNIVIGNSGVAAESNVIRIGTQGSGTGQQNTCYIAGITGVTVSNTNMVTINTSTGQLGSQTVPAGTVTSVSGTANQVAVANGTTTPVISLIGPYTPATYTAHGVLVGEGTSSIVAVGPNSASGIPLISQGSSSDPIFGTALVAGGGTGSTSFNTTGVVISGATSTTALTAVTLTDGQLAIGSSAGNPAAATLTAGAGISVTNGHNSITIAATGSEMVFTDESTSFSAAAGNGYFVTGAATATLPASPSQGNTICFIVDGAVTLTVTANTGQVIRVGSAVSASAGTVVNNARGDALTLVYRASDTAWISRATQGTWTVT